MNYKKIYPMKRSIVKIICLFFITNHLFSQESSFNPDKLKVEYFTNKTIKDGATFNDKEGKNFKIRNSDYSKGLYIKKDKKWLKHGVWFSMYKGRVTKKEVYSEGKKNGLSESYHKNGKVQFEYNYVNNLKEGMAYQYRADGSKVHQTPYKSNKMEGQRIEYTPKGKISFKKDYKNGLRHGEVLQYTNGKLVARTQYKEDKKVGKTKFY